MRSMPNLPDFMQAQLSLTQQLRDQSHKPTNQNIRLYKTLITNNLYSTLSRTFPILSKILGNHQWSLLIDKFLSSQYMQTRYFFYIAKDFLDFIKSTQSHLGNYQFIFQLAHFEWTELALEIAPDLKPIPNLDPQGNLLKGIPFISPLAQLLIYDYPVHQIDKKSPIPKPEPTILIGYRNQQHLIHYININNCTARLFQLLAFNTYTGQQALTCINKQLLFFDIDKLLSYGKSMFSILRNYQIILGTMG